MRKALEILFVLLPLWIFAQSVQFQQEQYPFPVTFYGVEPQMGFMQAGSYYHQDFGDIDGDGDFDIIISEVTPGIKYIKNLGTTQLPIFQLITTQLVPTFTDEPFHSVALCDIDNDSDLDLFISNPMGRITYWQYIGNTSIPNFALIDTMFEDIDVQDGPSIDFIDIDADGDYDLFIGVSWGTQNGRLYFYHNNGTPEEPNFVFVTDFFDSIDVGEQSSPEFCDIDDDGDYDLFIGCEDGTIWYYENVGDSANYDFQFVTSNYFNIDVGNMSVPRFVDIDGDGDYDLFVGNKSGGESVGIEGDIVFYENTGTATNPQFTFITSPYLFMDMGCSTGPAVVDLDDDSLYEILVGNGFGNLILLDNSGSQTDPVFYYADSAYLNLILPYSPQTSFADLDNDGDLDMVVTQCSFGGSVKIYKNIGTVSNPEYEFWMIITSSPNHNFWGPDFCDIDEDGDYDLFIYKDSLGAFEEYWENTGTIERPRFEFQTYNYFNQPSTWGLLSCRFGDFDHDGDYDLVMGQGFWSNHASYLIYWQNIGTPQNANLAISDTIAVFPASGMTINPCPSFADIDGDGDLDMFVGENGGALLFYRNMEMENASLVDELTISISENDVRLIWPAILIAEQYHIYYNDNPYFTPTGNPQAVVLPPDTSWTDENAVNQVKRYYRVVVEY